MSLHEAALLKWQKSMVTKCVHESMPLLLLLDSSSAANFLNFSVGSSWIIWASRVIFVIRLWSCFGKR